MPRRWLITDTHWDHKAIVEKFGRPANHGELSQQAWRELVAPEDTIIHLGDVIFAQASRLTEILASLPGHKIVIRGNHDQKLSWLLNHGFDEAYDSLVIDQVYLTHKPADALPPGCRLNVHGHLHDSTHHDHEYVKRPWHRLLALEHTNFRPVLFDQFTQKEK